MPRTLGLNIDSESSGGSSSWCQTDDESLETAYWDDEKHQGPPTHVWDAEESPTLSPLQAYCITSGTAVEIPTLPLLMQPSDYSSSENSCSIHQSCHIRSRVIRRRIEQLEQESFSSDCEYDDDFISSSQEPNTHRRRRPQSWRVYLALVAITMVVLSHTPHTRPPRPLVEIRREEIALGQHLRSHPNKQHKLQKYFMPKMESSSNAATAHGSVVASVATAAAASPSTTTTIHQTVVTTNHANFALAQTSHAARPVFERFEFRADEAERDPLPQTPLLQLQTLSWTTYFAVITFLFLLVETTYKEVRACRVSGRRAGRRL